MSLPIAYNGVTDIQVVVDRGVDVVINHVASLTSGWLEHQLPVFPVTISATEQELVYTVGIDRTPSNGHYVGEMVFGIQGADLSLRSSYVLLSINININHHHYVGDVVGLDSHIIKALDSDDTITLTKTESTVNIGVSDQYKTDQQTLLWSGI